MIAARKACGNVHVKVGEIVDVVGGEELSTDCGNGLVERDAVGVRALDRDGIEACIGVSELGDRLLLQLAEVGLAVELPELHDGPQIIEWIGCRSLACVVLDLGLPFEGGGLVLIEPVVATGTPVVVLTGESEPSLLAESIGRGAEVVLGKAEPLTEIVETILLVCRGAQVKQHQRSVLWADCLRLRRERDEMLAPFTALSPREQEVLAGLMAGHSPADLAERDFVSVQTVRTQIKSVLRKLGVRSQLEAVARANASSWQAQLPTGQEAGRT